MITPEQVARIRNLFHAEHWKVGTIAVELGLHPETVQRALRTDRFRAGPSPRERLTDPYLPFLRDTLNKHPRLRATRLFEMVRQRGYPGSVVQLRRVVRTLRPVHREAFLRLHPFRAEQAQADWAHFGTVTIGRAVRRLSCFLLTLSWSCAAWVEFFLDQSLENFLLGHVHAFSDWGGSPRTLLYDNLKSVVLDRYGDEVRFHPRFLELAAHYHFAPRPCRPGRGNEKGSVEKLVQYVRHSFFAARPFTTLADFNRQALRWRDEIAYARPWPGDRARAVRDAVAEERPLLLPLPAHPFDSPVVQTVTTQKVIFVRFDLNDYSIPPSAVGRPLTLVASQREVRILDGQALVARHRRSYDRGEEVKDPTHVDALLEEKRKALGTTPGGRLQHHVPESRSFLEAAFRRGESPARLTQRLLVLLDDYGPAALRDALTEAMERQTPTLASVNFLLDRNRRRGRPQPEPVVDLSRRPDLDGMSVEPHSPEDYDELAFDADSR